MNPCASLLTGLLLLTLVGCGDAPAPSDSSAPSGSSAPPGSSSPSDDPAGCADGSCQLRLTGPVQIPLQPQFDISELKVKSVGDDSVTLVARFTPGTGAQAISTGGSCSTEMESDGDDSHLKATCDTGTRLRLPTITIDLESAPAGAVLLRLSPR